MTYIAEIENNKIINEFKKAVKKKLEKVKVMF